MPDNAVYVGRPSRWGNPYRIGYGDGEYTPHEAVSLFRIWADDSRRGWEFLEPLRGRDLACSCPVDSPWCHADVLIELANR